MYKKLSKLLILVAFPTTFFYSDAFFPYTNLENPNDHVSNISQQSTTGPLPPQAVYERDLLKQPDSLENTQSEVVLPVPAYEWRHGCGPTALGMVIGYYDTIGYNDLVQGSAFDQTNEVNQMIASGGDIENPNPPGFEGNFEDYASPVDSFPNMIADAYITAGREPHPNNSIADYMDTSKSTRNNYYGWSWSSDVGKAFTGYISQRNPTYYKSFSEYSAFDGSLTWSILTSEIDSGKPMLFLVDSDGNGGTDHFVTIVGYRTSPKLQYGSWDTWSTSQIRWEDFNYIRSGIPWGIWGGWAFSLSGEPPEPEEKILYVKPDVIGSCSTWAQACDLQTAISYAVAGDQIWVAAGTYKPTTSANRFATFQLKTGVSIYGGFPINGGDWASRDWNTNLTILSGDIGNVGNIEDNSYHVVTGSGVNNTAVLDGFTITNGKANGEWPHTFGGGIYNELGSPTLKNLIIEDNYADNGAGIYNNESSPLVTNTRINFNNANSSGGGMYNAYNSFPVLENVSFSTNRAENSSGGGMFNWYSFPILESVTFSNNYAHDGGAIGNGSYANPTLLNVTISGNSALVYGGGISNDYFASPVLTNVTITGNSSPLGAGIYNPEGCYDWGCYTTTITMSNSILWGNTPDQLYNGENCTANISYTDIQGGFEGEGNINLDPFLGPLTDNGGLTLTHALSEGSPAIDAGSLDNYPSHDQRGYLRPIDGNGDGMARCDMGAYEYGEFLLSNIFLPLIQR
jgi:hypothetical protein